MTPSFPIEPTACRYPDGKLTPSKTQPYNPEPGVCLEFSRAGRRLQFEQKYTYGMGQLPLVQAPFWKNI
eukprot:4393187-Amphidinium_carterae.2